MSTDNVVADRRPVPAETPPASHLRLRKGGLLERVWQARVAYLFIAPAYIVFVVFILWPLLQAVRLGFYDAGLKDETFVALKNFVRLADDEAFRYALVNTVIFVVGVVPAILVLSIFVAVMVFPRHKHVQTFFRMAFYLPVVASGVVLVAVWKYLYQPTYGLLNYLLGQVGQEPILWLGSTEWSLPSLAIIVISWTIGVPIILFLAALGGIPRELYEAAMLDGATGWQQFWRITLPLLKPISLFVLVTQTIGVFQVFVVVQLLTAGGPAYATQTIVYRIWEVAFGTYEFGYASAMGVVLLLVIGAIAFVQFKFLGANVEY